MNETTPLRHNKRWTDAEDAAILGSAILYGELMTRIRAQVNALGSEQHSMPSVYMKFHAVNEEPWVGDGNTDGRSGRYSRGDAWTPDQLRVMHENRLAQRALLVGVGQLTGRTWSAIEARFWRLLGWDDDRRREQISA